jgi:D-glycero-D-manno-heptose 1,7-bisphosphate phosphatase
MISNLDAPLNQAPTKLLILDRDGTIIENVPYLKDKKLIKFKPHVFEGLLKAQEKGWEFIVATNQSGIGRKLVTIDEVNEVNQEISRILFDKGIKLRQFIFCPHLPNFGCECRKPKNGMIEEIIRIKQIKRNNIYLFGDMLTDVEAASKSGIKSFLLSENSSPAILLPNQAMLVKNFKEAIEQINH